MAARALVPFVLVTQVPSTVCDLLKELPPTPGPKIQHNHIHGTLLQVLFLLRSFQSDSHRPIPSENGIGSALRRYIWIASRQNCCLVTRGAFLDVLVSLCGPKISILEDGEVRELRREALSVLLESELLVSGPESLVPAPGSIQLLLSLSRVALAACVEEPEQWDTPHAPQLLESLLSSPCYEVRGLALDALLRQLQQRGSSQWLQQTTLSHLTGRAFHETHPHCLSKVLEVLCALGSTGPILWQDGGRIMAQEEVHKRLLSLTKTSAHSVDLQCAALSLLSLLVSHAVTSEPQDSGAAWCYAEWAAVVCSGCSEEQPLEVKMTASKVLVQSTAPVLTSPHLPLGFDATVSLWKSLVTLLQDEDKDVRDAAADFICFVPESLLSPDVCRSSVCPPLALDSAVGILCRLLHQWGRLSEGVLSLAEWLMGNEEACPEESAEAPSLDDEDFLFEKGELNLWAEPVQWVRLLHRHLAALLQSQDPESPASDPDRVRTLSDRAQSQTQAAVRSLSSLCPLPQFTGPMEHARLTLRLQRAQRAADVLHQIR
ncbi:unnamed protein product [Knipowitschia caucasica]